VCRFDVDRPSDPDRRFAHVTLGKMDESDSTEEPTEPMRSRRRSLLLVGVVLGSAAALGWFVWLPHHRPALLPGERYGIDVSHHQGIILWSKVAADGISFAYIKATEGGDFIDPQFAMNWAEAAAAGVDRGAYHFFTLCTPGMEQARNFLEVVKPSADALPPAVDLELTGNCSDPQDPGTIRRELANFIEVVESVTGRQVVLYVRDDFRDRYPVEEWFERAAWRFRFLRRPGEGWAIWQVSSFSVVDGIDGRVDLDVMSEPFSSAEV
jgi:lysozyme